MVLWLPNSPPEQSGLSRTYLGSLQRLRTNPRLLEVWLKSTPAPSEESHWGERERAAQCASSTDACVSVSARVHEGHRESEWEGRERKREREMGRETTDVESPFAKGCFSLLATTIDLARRHFYWIKRKLSCSSPLQHMFTTQNDNSGLGECTEVVGETEGGWHGCCEYFPYVCGVQSVMQTATTSPCPCNLA